MKIPYAVAAADVRQYSIVLGTTINIIHYYCLCGDRYELYTYMELKPFTGAAAVAFR